MYPPVIPGCALSWKEKMNLKTKKRRFVVDVNRPEGYLSNRR
jgi:hypothetical protein